MMQQLKLLASIDSLTQLYNRRYFHEISNHIFSLAKREEKELSIIMLDIDKFKLINDTYGHQIGDDALVFVARTLQENIRKSDIACRYGGEEFVLLLPNTAKEDAFKIAQKIREKIEQSSLQVNINQEVRFTISLGVSQIDCKKDIALETVIKRADEALYEAKNSGRNKVV